MYLDPVGETDEVSKDPKLSLSATYAQVKVSLKPDSTANGPPT